MINLNITARFDRLDRFIREDRVIRGEWGDGQERACLLLAIAPEVGYGDIDACPAGVIPPWLAELTPSIDDKVAAEDWSDIISTYARVVRSGSERFDAAGWRRVLARFMLSVLGDVAEHDTAGVVDRVSALWRRVLDGDEPSAQEWAAAAAAAAAAAEAEAAAAAEAAWAAAAAAAEAAAAAAAAAAVAAVAAAVAAAVEAAWAIEAAWSRIARHLFAAIEAEAATR
jgi:hypothetical protein